MLLRVARSGTERVDSPSPQNSTNLSTTPCLRSISVSVRTRSVAVAPGRSAPEKRTPTTIGDPRRSEEHTSELQSRGHLVCRLLLEKKKTHTKIANNHT